jgi:NAD(P)-dependent dehydrogenase (short-subunit alcohol dehydrogenase family)
VRGVPAGWLGQTAEVDALVAFLTSLGASYINGVEIPVDGGLLLGAGSLGQ